MINDLIFKVKVMADAILYHTIKSLSLLSFALYLEWDRLILMGLVLLLSPLYVLALQNFVSYCLHPVTEAVTIDEVYQLTLFRV